MTAHPILGLIVKPPQLHRLTCAMILLPVIFLTLPSRALADDAFYKIPLTQLKLLDGKLTSPAPRKLPPHADQPEFINLMMPRVTPAKLDSGETPEAYIAYPNGLFRDWGFTDEHVITSASLIMRAPAGKDITGKIHIPSNDWKSMTPLTFTIPASAADPNARDRFFIAKRDYYDSLLARDIPGAAWFRHEFMQAEKSRSHFPNELIRPPRVSPVGPRRADLDDTYSLFSGGRALSENLQLDRALLPRPGSGDSPVAIDTLKGITIAEMNWKPLIEGKHPQPDPLASLIPADQHAIFFPTFSAAMTLIDEADRQGTPILQAAEPRSEDARTKERYQRQLCLSLTGLGRFLGPQVINSIAVTGSDPYLRVGSDVALLFEPEDTDSLHKLLAAQITLASAINSGPAGRAEPVSGKDGDITYTGFVSPDRRVSTYLATIGNTVIITNSLAQLHELALVHVGKSKSIDTTPEYIFFRDRYKRTDADESALVILTDATIRRWCSAKWRIADSRRTRAAAVLSELQAGFLNLLATNAVVPASIEPGPGLPDIGGLHITPTGVDSAVYGNLEFMTPIAEMDLTHVTKTEADSYARWRDTYQQNWRTYFDPIAIRFSATPDKLAADLTVMPLIANTEYREMIDVSKRAALVPGTGGPHNALVNMAIAVNVKSKFMQDLDRDMTQFVFRDMKEPLSWVGQTVAVYVDDDPIWKEATKVEWSWEFLWDHFNELPIALYVQSTDAKKLDTVMTSVKSQFPEFMGTKLTWESLQYKDQPYVRVSTNPRTAPIIGHFTLYYSTSTNALLITPNEAILKRALDRRVAAAQNKLPADAAPWLGDSFAVQLTPDGLDILRNVFDRATQPNMQRQAWSNLPILNEWKRLYPTRDPVQFHEQLWQTRLIDPAGGRYVWNDKLQTMESTLYGCLESPKPGPGVPPALAALRRANFGITFENQGLRARVELYQGGPSKPAN